ncbi:TPA: hypothetical protein RVS15_004617 [Escherichia coli]|nr:hypothetical protein [Escherichia coli]
MAQGNNADLILQSLPHLKIREHLHDLPSGDIRTTQMDGLSAMNQMVIIDGTTTAITQQTHGL